MLIFPFVYTYWQNSALYKYLKEEGFSADDVEMEPQQPPSMFDPKSHPTKESEKTSKRSLETKVNGNALFISIQIY